MQPVLSMKNITKRFPGIIANDKMVHQHFKLVQLLTVTENIILGNEPKKGITLDITSAKKEVERLSVNELAEKMIGAGRCC